MCVLQNEKGLDDKTFCCLIKSSEENNAPPHFEKRLIGKNKQLKLFR